MNFGDLIFQLIALAMLIAPIVLIILIITFVVGWVKKAEKRADERLKFDQEAASLQEQQAQIIEKMNKRLINIEKTLKEID